MSYLAPAALARLREIARTIRGQYAAPEVCGELLVEAQELRAALTPADQAAAPPDVAELLAELDKRPADVDPLRSFLARGLAAQTAVDAITGGERHKRTRGRR